eukprot:CAMPEP_0194398274 /NCGR_PEP_ID=MMETSP0174-20130528/126012_1 /TAXON_ID=216777 /ORGANISM="Proboscia alata, Strain PI-D3" /LENGTH=397 /DNA_ID=CAMNT_0039194551 /DNA_START=281 /DNA_END=1473 /DNA_ORIENTATION=+
MLARVDTAGGNTEYTWLPQDLTKDTPGHLPIPDDDYVKKYQTNPELWPVEFFLIVYRRTKTNNPTDKRERETQLLVRESANGTSKWGIGTGVPATRWILSTNEPPPGYKWSEHAPLSRQSPRISFEASNFPEFPKGQKSWTFRKIDIRQDAFEDATFKDSELEGYARNIRESLRTNLSAMNENRNSNSWESSRLDVIHNVCDSANSVAAIQGTLRMSGLFAHTPSDPPGVGFDSQDSDSPTHRYVNLANAPDPATLVRSMRIYTMFPQMPDPMPHPSTPPDDLQNEIKRRDFHMAKRGRDPHQDEYGRIYTHKSTSNVSNTIHAVYFTLDATDLPGLDEVPALDLLGSNTVKREWKSLEDLKVLDSDQRIGTEDTKPTFISGFIVRQLVKDGVFDMQ